MLKLLHLAVVLYGKNLKTLTLGYHTCKVEDQQTQGKRLHGADCWGNTDVWEENGRQQEWTVCTEPDLYIFVHSCQCGAYGTEITQIEQFVPMSLGR